jgi:IMP dehydrogenase
LVTEVEIGMGKAARRAYGLGDVSIVPSRRTRDPEDVDVSWEIDAYRFEVPIMVTPADSVTSPATVVQLDDLGACGVLHLEGLWTRYEDPTPQLAEIASLPEGKATARMQEIYSAPIQLDLVGQRIADLRDAGVRCAVAVSPQRTLELAEPILRAEPDLLVIQATVVSAEHVSRSRTEGTLNLKEFIRHYEIPVIVGGCTSYQSALHLMRTGAAGILVGTGTGNAGVVRDVLGLGVPLATALADARAARMRHLDETGVYVQIIADGGITTGGDIARAVVCGADAVMIGTPLAAAHEAPGRGWHWGLAATHGSLPRGSRVAVPAHGSFEEILRGPSHEPEGRLNLVGALRRAMASCGYDTLKELQKAELVLSEDLR